MRPVVILLLLTALLISACGGNNPAPTNTAPPTAPAAEITLTPDPTLFVTSTPSPLEILARTVTVPVPGTLSVPDGLGVQRAFRFNTINFTQTQVQGTTSLNIVLRGDGTVTRDGVNSQATPEQIQAISRMLGEMDFYAMRGQFTDGDAASSTFTYSLTIDGDEGSRTIYAQYNLTPPPLMAVFDALRALVAT